MKNYEDAEEFILRTLAMDGKNIKVVCDREISSVCGCGCEYVSAFVCVVVRVCVCMCVHVGGVVCECLCVCACACIYVYVCNVVCVVAFFERC